MIKFIRAVGVFMGISVLASVLAYYISEAVAGWYGRIFN